MNSRVVSLFCTALMLMGISTPAQHAFTELRQFGFTARAASQPLSRLAMGPGGWLYGSSRGGHGAVIYKVKNDGTEFSIIYDFGGTNFPSRGALIVGSDGALYGTVILPNGVDGGVYRIQPNGSGLQIYALPVAAETI